MLFVHFLIFLFFPVGYGVLGCFLITSFGGTKNYSTPVKKNIFFYLWIIQAIVWTMMVNVIE